MSSFVTSRCVTARATPGRIVSEIASPPSRRRRDPGRAIEVAPGEVELDEVRLDLLEAHGQPGGLPRLGEPPRAGVVVGQPLDVVVERVQRRRRDDPGLPHRAAEEVLLAPRACHQLGGAGDDRPERATEPLREAERHRVEPAGDRGRGNALGDRGVEEAGAVEVGSEAERAGAAEDVRQPVEGPAAPAGRVVRVLEHEHRRPLVDPAGRRPRHALDLLRRDQSVLAHERLDHQARMERRAAELVHEHVAEALGDQHVPRAREEPQRDLVGHRGRRQEQRRLVPEKGSSALLEGSDGRILAHLLVADRRGCHRGEHRRRRPGHGVRAEIDHRARSGSTSSVASRLAAWISPFSTARSPAPGSRRSVAARSGSGPPAAQRRTRR